LFGYQGSYLLIDVGTGASHRIPLAESDLHAMLGGVGLATWLLQNHEAASLDPYDSKAPIVFAFSPLVGSPLTTSAKFVVACKSPLTDRLNDSLASSSFAIAGKRTGFDAIILIGQASRPTIVMVDQGEVRLESAEGIWSLPIDETESRLKEAFPGFKSAVIGPAGENLVRFATISHDGRHAGRGGSGAVLGAKRIKALLVRGNQQVEWAHPARLVARARDLSEKSFGPATAKYRELGTATNLLAFNRLNCLPTRNFQSGQFAEAESISPESLAVSRERTRSSCAACTIGCEHLYSLQKKPAANGASPAADEGARLGTVRLEYESLFAFGPLCGISDSQTILQAIQICDRMGMDTISAGCTLALAMECDENGWRRSAELKFGDGKALLTSLQRIAKREGDGANLAEGSRRLAASIGPHAMAIAPQVKGLEIPGYDPRTLQTMALGFAVGSRGADHNRSGAYEADFSEGSQRFTINKQSVLRAIETEDRAVIMDSLILCKFIRGALADFYGNCAEMLNLVTGWSISANDLERKAAELIDLKKEFNIAAGWTKAEDTLPERFFQPSTTHGHAIGISRTDFENAIAQYYHERNWDGNGLPKTHARAGEPRVDSLDVT
jgi:aldehyde:ferredoxin oxidoreductase